MPRFDSVDLTSPSEYGSREGEKVSVLQIHHATTTSLSGLRSLMAPGGRTVSANGAMGNDGHLMNVVPTDRRAFTSATGYDRRSFTVECCNTSLGPRWGISDATHERLAELAVDLHREFGMPLDRAHIIGHSEVPGTYATACPGPSMDLDRIVRRAREIEDGDMGYSTWTPEERVNLVRDVWEYGLKSNLDQDRGKPVKAGHLGPIPAADFLRDIQQFARLAGTRAITVDIDETELAKALLPSLVQALGSATVSDEDIAALRTDLLAAIGQVDENTLATFGLKRA
jgi:N-acetyl-anhydromuramyl-L-alanine amidase AmpD